MATRGIVYVVFLLPIISSIVFGTLVLNGILIEEPNRELNMWHSGGSHSDLIEIIGLAQQYPVSAPIKILVSVDDPSFDCGDLYVTIYSAKNDIITQSGFFQQCFVNNNSQLPINDKFSETIGTPGQYTLIVEMNDKSQKNTISASGMFTVK